MSPDGPPAELLRALPPVNDLVDHPEVVEAASAMRRPLRVSLARRLLDEVRAGVVRVSPDGDVPGALAGRLATRARVLLTPGPGEVLNATGVPLHTNLGRAPLGPGVRAAMAAASGYTDLELDLASGERGDRNRRLGQLLALLCDTEGGLAVNNCAAAVMLAGRALAAGGEVLISRGELVEIGGSFRVPEVIESAGARLVEVGTTNRTRAADYARALTPETRMILKVHRSNFRLEGFTQSAPREELAEVARDAGVPLVEDLGSGSFLPLEPHGLSEEPTPGQVLAAGVDLVTFSGDKLLGGVQSGLVAGRGEVVTRLAKSPLMRALRLDKVLTAGIQAALSAYLREEAEICERMPVQGMMARRVPGLRAACEELAAALRGLGLEPDVVDTGAPVGGGSCPGDELAGAAVAFADPAGKPARLAKRLRLGKPPLVVRVEDDRLWIDPRTLGEDVARVPALVAAALN